MSAILAKMAVQISANNADFNKAMVASSKSLKGFSAEAELSQTKVGQLATKISSFANPVTAAIAVVGGLTAAYASSTIGAKDLEFAHKQLAAATMIVSNAFASLFSGVEDGEGAISKITNFFLNAINPALGATSQALAKVGEALEDLQRDEKIARAEVNQILQENVDKMTDLQESQISMNEKTHIAGEILDNINVAQDKLIAGSEDLVKNGTLLTKAELETAGVLTKQLQSKQQQLNADKNNEKLMDERAMLILEISGIEKDMERQRQKVFRLESNLLDVERRKTHEVQKQVSLKTQQATGGIVLGELGSLINPEAINNQINLAIANLQRLPQNFTVIAKEMVDISGLVSGGIADIANSFGEAATGSVNFGDAILKSLANFAQQFGALLIATGVGKIAFDKFKSGPAMIAAGAALVALGSAVRGAISSRPNLGGGSSSGGGNSFPERGIVTNQGFQNLQLQTAISGSDINIALGNQMIRDSYTRPRWQR